jgi:hypothetical protein
VPALTTCPLRPACSQNSAGDTDSGKWTVANQLRKTSGKKTIPKKLTGVPLAYTLVAVEDEDGPAGAHAQMAGRWPASLSLSVHTKSLGGFEACPPP